MTQHHIAVDVDTAKAVAEALDYYLAASANNFGDGYGSDEVRYREAMTQERIRITKFAERVSQIARRP